MNSSNSSVNLSNSLSLLSDFENKVISDSDLENLSLSDVKTLMEMIRFSLNSLNEEKGNFISSTHLRENSPTYKKQIAIFNQRKRQINKSYLVVESKLRREKEIWKNSEKERQESENRFLFMFFRAAKNYMHKSDFNSLIEMAEKDCKFPETLRERV